LKWKDKTMGTMNKPAPAIPYEKQNNQEATRSCGAACLSMVYRSFGVEAAQDDIWPAISKPNRFGIVSSITHLMAQDALNRGFSAIAFQARHPLQVLRLCRDLEIRAILNHRIRPDSTAGHYSVFVDIEGHSIVLHDPLLGPSRTLKSVELVDLWLPRSTESEVVGNVVIAIAEAGAVPAGPCVYCHTRMPANVECPQCKKVVDLAPGAALGCVRENCIARLWNFICCPHCDYCWSFTVSDAGGGPEIREPQPAQPQMHPGILDINKLFGQVDKFTAMIASAPGAMEHPEVKAQLDLIASAKQKFKQGYAERLLRQASIMEGLARSASMMKEQEEAQQKVLEEMNKPPAPLDGDALGQALLKNLGLK
jgi:hypothetical protein